MIKCRTLDPPTCHATHCSLAEAYRPRSSARTYGPWALRSCTIWSGAMCRCVVIRVACRAADYILQKRVPGGNIEISKTAYWESRTYYILQKLPPGGIIEISKTAYSSVLIRRGGPLQFLRFFGAFLGLFCVF
jgi:hypothetical protein